MPFKTFLKLFFKRSLRRSRSVLLQLVRILGWGVESYSTSSVTVPNLLLAIYAVIWLVGLSVTHSLVTGDGIMTRQRLIAPRVSATSTHLMAGCYLTEYQFITVMNLSYPACLLLWVLWCVLAVEQLFEIPAAAILTDLVSVRGQHSMSNGSSKSPQFRGDPRSATTTIVCSISQEIQGQ